MFTLIHTCTTAPLRGSRLASIAIERVLRAAGWPQALQLFSWDLGPPEYRGLLPQSGSEALCPAKIRYSDNLHRYTDLHGQLLGQLRVAAMVLIHNMDPDEEQLKSEHMKSLKPTPLVPSIHS